MLNYIEVTVILICGVIFAKDSYTSKDSTAIRLATKIFVALVFLGIFFIIKGFTITGAHIYTVIVLLGIIGLILEKNKAPYDDGEKKQQKPQQKHQGINRPTPNPKSFKVNLPDTKKPYQPKKALIKKNKKTPKRNPLSKNTQLKNIAFNYTNSNGVFTYREVDVKKVDENYVFGYCHSRQQMRTFRLDRIEDDEVIIRDSGEVLNVYDWIVQLYPVPEEY
ncbi:WYL domain-containing protein [Serratia symbiotica]|uniref:WYL domain-containing protein n=1 Tax=Serratia symbiotica TaxID=138074 RepID=UPI001CF06B43|nr:WYL domain-containing protein [Serratia symbiotica]